MLHTGGEEKKDGIKNMLQSTALIETTRSEDFILSFLDTKTLHVRALPTNFLANFYSSI
jgi:hypothetical protein